MAKQDKQPNKLNPLQRLCLRSDLQQTVMMKSKINEMLANVDVFLELKDIPSSGFIWALEKTDLILRLINGVFDPEMSLYRNPELIDDATKTLDEFNKALTRTIHLMENQNA